MAAKSPSMTPFSGHAKITRHGIHAKTKTSKCKGSKNYKKPYRGQGRV